MVIEQRNAEIKRGHDDFVQAITDPENQPSQWGTVTLALAQQGEQQPVAWYEYNQDLDAWFLAYGHNPKAKTRPLVFGDTAAPAPQAQEPCPNGEPCKHGAWCTEVYCQELCEFRNQPAPQAQELRGSWALDEISLSAPAPQPAQDVPEVGFGNMPTKFLANGTRFKLSFDTRGKVSSLWNFMDELDGRWVALVAAEDDCHLQSAQPVAQPLSDSEIEKLREKTFSTYNPYCPVDSKSMRKAVRAAEAAHGIGEVK